MLINVSHSFLEKGTLIGPFPNPYSQADEEEIHMPFDNPSIHGESDVEGAEEVVVPVLQETLDIPSALAGLYRDK